MNTLISNLIKFNRKERYFLIGNALGNKDFILSDEFRISIQKCLQKLKVNIPRNAFVAIDYHLDWIFASIFLTIKDNYSMLYPCDEHLIKANQEDIDLIIAFNEKQNNNNNNNNYNNNLTHLILCECKAATGWNNKQFKSKAERLRAIFGEDGKTYKNIVIPYLLLLSPRQPKKLDVNDVPEIMKVNGNIPWMELSVPNDLQKVTICDSSGKNCENGDYWKVEKT